MAARRLPLTGAALRRGPEVTISLDGRAVRAHEGETVAAVLFAEGVAATRRTVGGAPRGVYCGMGVCFECLVVVDGIPNTRACMTWVREGLDVRRQDGLGAAGAGGLDAPRAGADTTDHTAPAGGAGRAAR